MKNQIYAMTLLVEHKGNCSKANQQFLDEFKFHDDKHPICNFCFLQKTDCLNTYKQRLLTFEDWLRKHTSKFEEE